MFFLAIVTVLTFIMTARSMLVLLGAYKDPLLANFEKYGEEHFFSPLITLIFWAGIFIYLSLYWYFPPATVFGLGLFIIIPLGSLYGIIIRGVKKYKEFFSQHPRWFYELLQMTDREERRRIAYMWLFLPASTRMLYNANNHLFRQWVEQVVLTVAAPLPTTGTSKY